MKRVEDTSYLEQRGRVWWCNRRVPSRFAKLDTRTRIKQSPGTTSIDQPRYKRDRLAEADDHYWAFLMLAIDYGLRCLLMGHKTTRPVYGVARSHRLKQFAIPRTHSNGFRGVWPVLRRQRRHSLAASMLQ